MRKWGGAVTRVSLFVALLVVSGWNVSSAFANSWGDYRQPFTGSIKTCLDAPGEEISVNLPREFLDQHDEIDLYLKFRSYLYDGGDSVPKPGFSRWRPHVRVNKHIFSGRYPLSVSKFPAEQEKTISIKSDVFEPGDNTITLSFVRNSGSDGHKSIGSHKCLTLIYKEVSLPQAPSPATRLMISSTPSGADVSIGGSYKGTTPFSGKFASGSYGVKVSKAGFKEEFRQVRLWGESKNISIDLKKDQYQVAIGSTPPGADTYVNGEHRGRTPLYLDLAPDTYEIKVAKEGFETEVQSVAVTSVRKRLSFDLKKGAALLEVVSVPAGAVAYIDGKKRGQTPLNVEVAPGSHQVKVTKKGYRTRTTSVHLENGKEKLSLTLARAEASVNFDTNVEKASVYIDDTLRGYTPLAGVTLSLGTHTVRLEKEGYEPIREKVTVTQDTDNIFRDLRKTEVNVVVVEKTLPEPAAAPVDSGTNGRPVSLSKLALVIGNSDYENAPLRNPVNDAEDMSNTLRGLGFEVITATNATKRKMLEAMYRFEDKLRRTDIGLFFYAGHGMQLEGTNYLIPIGTNVHNAVDVEFEAVNVNRILGKMKEAGNTLNIVALDACRNSPFRGFIRSGDTGLARMEAPVGTLIAYATSPGAVAYDGDGRNGIFTKHLLLALKEDNLTVRDIFDYAGIGVMEETNNRQVPWIHSSPMKPVYISD